MEKYSYLSWLETAGKQMRFPPDREAVLNELSNHMADRREDFIRQGMSPREAGEAVAAVMGDPVEVGRTMNRIHSPVLGWIWQGSRILLLVVLVLSAAWGIFHDDFSLANMFPFPDGDWELHGCEYSLVPYLQGDYTETVVQTGLVEKAGVYTLQLDHGSWVVGEEQQRLTLGFRLKAESLLDLNPLGFSHWLCAEDDLGNVYKRQSVGSNAVFTSANATNMFECEWRAPYFHLIWNVQDAIPRQWIRFYIPDTDFSVTVTAKGRVSG